ncbi:chloramphenicol resistance protein [Coniochaeta ligniaria NRRL 30616]|uniref:Chloramphenicol resistance protein n=1 Tax=Coniochaeta ligniaria NRRL 30616 TaxID=1408157 RepID=A0A1J7JCL1_9PEZI|nr:chloramphenicol resistance protein [Coniochaeta ligniaria NRRL 30616]
MFSPLTANIYLPCVPVIQSECHTTLELMNLTITAYIVIQGIAPTFFSQLSDRIGRRPVYMLTFGLFVGSSIGLALQDSYAALLVLRMVQSFGSSVSVAIGYAVVADIAAPAERGRIMALTMMMLNLGPVIAPVIGGPVCYHAGWRWIFWILTIVGGFFLLAVVLFLPETNRKIVGNGSVVAKGLNKPILPFLVPRTDVYAHRPAGVYPSFWHRVRSLTPNPLTSAVLVFQKDTSCVLFAAATFYMMYYVSQASLPALYRDAYGYSESDIGLCYLALGSGVFCGGQLQGEIMDWNYRMTAKEVGWEVNHIGGDDLSRFPIERARARMAWLFQAMQCTWALAYGWAVHYRVHPAVPLIFQFLQGLFGYSWNALIVEIHRESPGNASAAGNLTRCFLAASGVAIMEPLMAAMGPGPFFTLLSGVCAVVGITLTVTIRTKGMKWRLAREKAEAEKRES